MLRLSIPQQQLCSSQALYSLGQSAKRNLGCAILIAAIEDYQSLDEHVHAGARRFLYPVRQAYRKQYEWAVGLAQNVNPDWLRSALDKAKKHGIASGWKASSERNCCGIWKETERRIKESIPQHSFQEKKQSGKWKT